METKRQTTEVCESGDETWPPRIVRDDRGWTDPHVDNQGYEIHQ